MPNVNDRAIVLRIGSSSVGDKTLIPRCGCAQVDVSELLETQGRNVACPCPYAAVSLDTRGLYREAVPHHMLAKSFRRAGCWGSNHWRSATAMPNLATTLSVLLAVVAGATIIRLLHRAVRWLSGRDRSFNASAVLVRDRVDRRDLLLLAVPPILGGMLVVFWPATNGGIAGASGLLAAFLDVWPVYQFPGDLLDDDLLQFWPTLKILNGLFVGMSAALTYLGFIVVDRIVPVSGTLSRARAWQRILDGMSASARFGPVKYALATLLVLGGLYFNRERARIGARATTHRPPQA